MCGHVETCSLSRELDHGGSRAMTKKPKKAAPNSQKKTPKKATQKNAKSTVLHCVECDKAIAAKEQCLFVEEDVGRFFCSEPCIVNHFSPDIEKLEREYGKHVSATDLTSEERERFAHLRWMALEQPDEVWCEKTAKGDLRHVLIAQYRPENKTVWAVSICLMLRGDPSFLYLAFVTNDQHLVDQFRKGEKLKIAKKNIIAEEIKEVKQSKGNKAAEPALAAQAEITDADRLAEPWTEADSLRASILKSRRPGDISSNDYGFYQNCLEETLQEPNELWSHHQKGVKKVYHFIRFYEHDSPFWYVVMAKDTTDETQIEIVDAFPTNDDSVVQLCRYGKKENLGNQNATANVSVEDGKIRNVH